MMTRLRSRPLLTVSLYFLLYQAVFVFLEQWKRVPHIVHCRLDDWIPFIPAAVVPYVLWFAWVPLTMLWLLRRDRERFWRLFFTIACGTAFALAVYAVYPTIQLRRRTLYGRDVFTSLIRFIYTVDTPTNVCPSLHVFVSVAVLLAVCGSVHMARRYKLLHGVLAVAICLSTVVIRQHSCVDVVCGLALAFAVYALVGRYLARSFGPWPERQAWVRLRRARA